MQHSSRQSVSLSAVAVSGAIVVVGGAHVVLVSWREAGLLSWWPRY
jgi:hypothetical protein